ncbi:MAG: penicillin-binding protein 2, partial [Aquificota bacterium]
FPSQLSNKEELARRLSAVLGVSEEQILERLDSGKKFVWVARNIDKDYLPYIKAVLKETGNDRVTGIEEDFKRVYPHSSLLANLLGFVGAEGKGLEGLEYKLEPIIQPKEIKVLFFATAKGGRLPITPISDDTEPKDVYLTIDLGVQTILEDIKDKIARQWNPDRIGLLVMDARSGDILGIANYPSYDPNNYQKYPPQHRKNYVVSDLFEPGSVMKPFFIGQALEKGYVKPGMVIDTENGKTEVFGRYVKDVHPYKSLTLEGVLIKSSNVGTIKVARFLSKRDVQELMEKFHFNDEFHILPGEVKPKLPNFNYPANILYAGIGQGMASNLLNLCVAFNGLATNKIVKPRILLSEEPKVLKEGLFSEKTLKWLHENLRRVVEEGTATRARSEYFTIAGKTGTSQKFDFSTGKYSREKVVAYFVGYFPASDPKFVAGIMVDNPRGPNLYGGTVAAPYFKELVERVAYYYRLEPDKLSK